MNDKQRLIELASQYIVSRALHVMVEMKIADRLEGDFRSVQEIATALSCSERGLNSLFRVLETEKLVKSDGQGNYALTERGKLLRTDHPDALCDIIMCDTPRWNAFGELEYAIKDGKAGFDKAYGTTYFEHMKKDPALSAKFDRHMRAVSKDEDACIAETLEISSDDKLMDIGGGVGGLLSAILKKHGNSKGILFDLPQVVEQVSEIPEQIKVVGGDFFDHIPGPTDVILLKRILHDWDARACIKILKNCKRALSENGIIYILETVLEGDLDPSVIRRWDLLLFAVFGGNERSFDEYEILVCQAGLSVISMRKLECGISIIGVRRY